MARFWNRLRGELLEMVPPFLFFLVAFQAIAFTRSMILEHYSIDGAAAFTATFAALIVAKAVLLADLMPFINRFPDKPLVYNTLWKAGIYVFVAILLHTLEEIVPLVWKHGFDGIVERAAGEIVWTHFWSIQVWLAVLFLIYCAAAEVVRVLGRDRVKEMFFGRHSVA